MNRKELKDLEKLENKYLKKYTYFLKFAEDEILAGLDTGRKNRDYWESLYGKGISVYSRGAERVLYALLNGKGIGEPNSAPVGSDLFFEVYDAYIHIDLKSTGASLEGKSNIGDYNESIPVGENQNSYEGIIELKNGNRRSYKPKLPKRYTISGNTKPCLTYFISLLYDFDTLQTLLINISCMPNGDLEQIYKSRPLKAGKSPGKPGSNPEARFHYSKTPYFELLKDQLRIQVPYVKKRLDEKYKSKLKFLLDIHQQSIK